MTSNVFDEEVEEKFTRTAQFHGSDSWKELPIFIYQVSGENP